MLSGKRPPECQYCWKIEDLPGDHNSDRHIKSNDTWAKPYLKEIAHKPWSHNTVPTYLEVSFSNICNFQCSYCQPADSSRWMNEVKRHGPYPTSDHFGSLLYAKKRKKLPLPDNENPYTKAFWDWFPQIYNHLHELRVTGGEPLLAKDCDKLLDYLVTHPAPQLNFNLNSNFGISSLVLEKALKKMSFLLEAKSLKSVSLYTSLDSWGKQAEYIRYGLDLELWKKNLTMALESLPDSQVTIMVTYNLLGVFNFLELLKFVSSLRAQYGLRIFLDISLLHSPTFLGVSLLPEKFRPLVDQHVAYMSNPESGFVDYEINKMMRIREFIQAPLKSSLKLHWQRDFISYIQEYDRRKNLSFLEVFPEMTQTWEDWRRISPRRRWQYRMRNRILKSIERFFFK